MAGIIKALVGRRPPPSAQATPFNFEDLATKANVYLETVKTQAQGLLEEARKQADTIRAQAEARGQEAAMAAARKAVQAEFERKTATLLPALQQAIHGIQETRQSWLQRWETEAVRLAIAIAERIVRGELSREPQIAQQWMREALALASSGGQVRLLLHPDDYRAFEDKADQFLKQLGEFAPASVAPDPSVSPGGCRVLTSQGEIDARLETQLQRIAEELA